MFFSKNNLFFLNNNLNSSLVDYSIKKHQFILKFIIERREAPKLVFAGREKNN
jgi:hypothetical protein